MNSVSPIESIGPDAPLGTIPHRRDSRFNTLPSVRARNWLNIPVERVPHDNWYYAGLAISIISFVLLLIFHLAMFDCKAPKMIFYIGVGLNVLLGISWLLMKHHMYRMKYPKNRIKKIDIKRRAQKTIMRLPIKTEI